MQRERCSGETGGKQQRGSRRRGARRQRPARAGEPRDEQERDCELGRGEQCEREQEPMTGPGGGGDVLGRRRDDVAHLPDGERERERQYEQGDPDDGAAARRDERGGDESGGERGLRAVLCCSARSAAKGTSNTAATARSGVPRAVAARPRASRSARTTRSASPFA